MTKWTTYSFLEGLKKSEKVASFSILFIPIFLFLIGQPMEICFIGMGFFISIFIFLKNKKIELEINKQKQYDLLEQILVKITHLNKKEYYKILDKTFIPKLQNQIITSYKTNEITINPLPSINAEYYNNKLENEINDIETNELKSTLIVLDNKIQTINKLNEKLFTIAINKNLETSEWKEEFKKIKKLVNEIIKELDFELEKIEKYIQNTWFCEEKINYTYKTNRIGVAKDFVPVILTILVLCATIAYSIDLDSKSQLFMMQNNIETKYNEILSYSQAYTEIHLPLVATIEQNKIESFDCNQEYVTIDKNITIRPSYCDYLGYTQKIGENNKTIKKDMLLAMILDSNDKEINKGLVERREFEFNKEEKDKAAVEHIQELIFKHKTNVFEINTMLKNKIYLINQYMYYNDLFNKLLIIIGIIIIIYTIVLIKFYIITTN